MILEEAGCSSSLLTYVVYIFVNGEESNKLQKSEWVDGIRGKSSACLAIKAQNVLRKACNHLTEHIYDLAIQGINMSRPGLNMSVLIDTSKSSGLGSFMHQKHISTLFQIISIKKRQTNCELSYIVAYHYISSTTNAYILFLTSMSPVLCTDVAFLERGFTVNKCHCES